MSTREPETIVLSEEQARVGTRRVAAERVILRRRVVTETRTVEVTLRREELEVEHVALDAGQAVEDAPREPLVIVLREEVPDVSVRVRPYEQVRVSVETVTEHQVVQTDVRRERLEVDTKPAS